MTPERVLSAHVTPCCGVEDNVALDSAGDAVVWCACGKVYVTTMNGKWRVLKQIHDFCHPEG